MTPSNTENTAAGSSHQLHKELGLRDLVPMQILLVVGVTWSGLAARQGTTHVAFWLLGIVTLFLPVAGVVHYCAKIWPLEGGVYQWTRSAIGPFAGFLSAWNFGIWALMAVSSLGIQTAASLSYALGPQAAWMVENGVLITALNVGLFGFILLVNIPGLGIGRWVAHFGTAVTLLVTVLLILLLFIHPHASAAHPHVSPQRPFSLALPVVTLMSLNLFSKLTFNALTGLEQVAVFAGETRHAGRSILRSAWIAAPVIALIYICMAGAMLTYTSADNIDLTAPIPQVLAAAFGSGASADGGLDAGLILGRAAILVLAIATVAQYAVIVAEISRLPMVAAWDHLLPAWFTRLHPRYRTPTRSLAVIVALAVLLSLLASANTGSQEAFQLLVTSGNVCYGINYLLMFAVPLMPARRLKHRPGLLLRVGCVSGIAVTMLQIIFGLVPVVDVTNSWAFGLKIGLTALAANLLAAALYWRGIRQSRSAIKDVAKSPPV
ncbi:MAG TPA: APC family permease [Steroidobacteraceae bacterium]|jgi:amino acid transporter|nr:APC family permease [Steroidobacteraceae bacterium]